MIDSKEFLKEVKIAKKYIGKTGSTKKVLLMTNPMGLTIKTTNLGAQYESTLVYSGTDYFECCVDCSLLEKLLGQNESLRLNIEIVDDELILTNSDETYRLNTSSTDDFPQLIPSVLNNTIPISGYELSQSFKDLNFKIPPDEIRPFINGMFLEVFEGDLHIVSTDNRMSLISEIKINKIIENKEIGLVEKNQLPAFLPCLKESKDTFIHFNDCHVVFECGVRSLTLAMLDGSFPDYKKLFLDNMENYFIVDTKKFEKACKKISLLDDCCKIEIEGKNILIGTANNKNYQFSADFNPLTMNTWTGYFNPDYLSIICKVIGDKEIQIDYSKLIRFHSSSKKLSGFLIPMLRA